MRRSLILSLLSSSGLFISDWLWFRFCRHLHHALHLYELRHRLVKDAVQHIANGLNVARWYKAVAKPHSKALHLMADRNMTIFLIEQVHFKSVWKQHSNKCDESQDGKERGAIINKKEGVIFCVLEVT